MNSSLYYKYDLKDELDKGTYYNTYKVLNKYNKMFYVLKKIPFKDEIQLNIIKDKILSIKKLENEYLVKIFEYFPDKNNFKIIMEYFNGYSLRNFINEQSNKIIEEEIILYIFLNICLGLKDLHNNNLVCIYLNPENIFINEDLIFKIGDFGIPIQLIKNLDFFNDVFYSENIDKNERKEYNYKDNIGALGNILLELCNVKNFSKKGDKQINTEYYGYDLQNLIYQLLNEDYNARPDINMILEIINNIILNHNMNIEKRQKILLQNKVFTKYMIQKNIEHSLENEEKRDILSGNINMINLYEQIFKLEDLYNMNMNEKKLFINENIDIIKVIEEYSLKFIVKKINEKISKNSIIIYNQNNFAKNIKQVANLLTSENLINDQRLKNIKRNNYNIVLINNGDGNLINEFLNLKNVERIEEPNYNNEEFIDLKMYNGKRNNKIYTFLI